MICESKQNNFFMISIKTKKEIDIMRQGGKILSSILDNVMREVKSGISTMSLRSLAEKLINQSGGIPSFKGYQAAWSEDAYPAALCVSINDEVVHGIPTEDKIIKTGDVVGLDCGLRYKGLYTDMAKTVIVGRTSKEIKKMVSVAKIALMSGIKEIAPGKYISDISRAIQIEVEKNGFSVVRQLVGHGVGRSAHEEPQVPNYVSKDYPKVELKAGMTLALEPMVNLGSYEVETGADGWTISTVDKKPSAHFEHTVLVTDKGYEILTK